MDLFGGELSHFDQPSGLFSKLGIALFRFFMDTDQLFSGGDIVGEHDLDDVDPQFVDQTRTPISWDASLGGSGTIEETMERIGPVGDSSTQDLLDYIREGFQPQNALLKGAGDPDATPPNPDIGAVDL